MKDLRFQQFGRLLPIQSYSQKQLKLKKRNRGRFWYCLCNCGKTALVETNNLTSGEVRSCGCLAKEHSISNLAKARKTKEPWIFHGLSRTPEYKSWNHMLQRCNNKNHINYHNYGGRGIKVCDRWVKFKSFLEDMGFKPSPNHTIDRINSNSNYEPSNCRWATKSEQRQNRRNCITFNGIKREIKIYKGIIHLGIYL